MIDKPVYLTQEGHDQLKAELKRRIDEDRPAIADRIKQAKDLGIFRRTRSTMRPSRSRPLTKDASAS